MRQRTKFSLVAAALAGCSTLSYSTFAVLSENTVLAGIQRLLIAFITPGLVAAVFITGMADVHLVLGATMNALFYFGMGWSISALIARFTRNAV